MSIKKIAKYSALIVGAALLFTISCAAIYRYIAQSKISRSRAIHSPDGI